jgi:predicted HTH transcriptional regulator
MNPILVFLLGALIGGLGVWLVTRGYPRGSLAKAHQAAERRKETAQGKILSLVKEKGKVTNDEVQALLKVSDATATRYLESLEQKGQIIQQGRVGRGVFYVPKNGSNAI